MHDVSIGSSLCTLISVDQILERLMEIGNHFVVRSQIGRLPLPENVGI